MPKIRRRKLPPDLLRHILLRAKQRQINYAHVEDLYRWLGSDPVVPEGKWYKRFPNFILCGEGEFVKTFLLPGHLPTGEEIQ